MLSLQKPIWFEEGCFKRISVITVINFLRISLPALCPCPCISEVWDSYPTWDIRRTMHFSSFLELVQHVITTGKDLGAFCYVDLDSLVPKKHLEMIFPLIK